MFASFVSKILPFLRGLSFVAIASLGVSAAGLVQDLAEPCSQPVTLVCPKGKIDACLIPGSKATNHFCTTENAKRKYERLGGMWTYEGSSGSLFPQS